MITKILIEANEEISEKEKQEKIKNLGHLYLGNISVPEKINFLEIVNFLGIPTLSAGVVSSLINHGWELMEQLYKNNPETNTEELLISNYTLYFIIKEIKKRVVQNERQLAWNTEKQEKINAQIKTLDQAIFMNQFINFLEIYKSDLANFLIQNPNAIKIFETFPIEIQQILQDTRNQFGYHRLRMKPLYLEDLSLG